MGGFELKDFSKDRLVQLFWSTIEELCKFYNIGIPLTLCPLSCNNIHTY